MTAEDIASRLRAKINPEVLTCDLHKENPLDPIVPEPYDIITSQLCLQVVSRSKEEYQRVIRSLATMLKPGGALFEFGCIEETYYTFNNAIFKTLKVNVDLVRKVYENAGFTHINCQTQIFSETELATFAPINDAKGFYLISACK